MKYSTNYFEISCFLVTVTGTVAEILPCSCLAYSIFSKLKENIYTIFSEGGNNDSVVDEGNRRIRCAIYSHTTLTTPDFI